MMSSVERYDPLSDSWTARASMANGLWLHHVGGYPIEAIMGELYIFGGLRERRNSRLESAY